MEVTFTTHKNGIDSAGSKKHFMAFFLFFLIAGGVFAQNAETETGVFSPFVSRLTAETRNNLVRLSWSDSRDVRGPVYIFRSIRPFTGTSPSDLRPVEISYGTQSYVDETDGAGPFYYFVAASDTQGQRYDIFIPYTNTTIAVFAPESWPGNPAAVPAAPLMPQVPPAQTAAVTRHSAEAVISGLTALTESDGVIISFAVTGNQKTTVLYRSTQPIRRIQDLLNAVIVQSGISSPFIDYPAPGSSYYYAALFEDDISRGTVEVQPGRNATINAIAVTGQKEAAQGIRSMPLPSLSVYKTSPGSDAYSMLPRAVPLSGKTTTALDTVTRAESGPPSLKRPRVFARDLEVPSGGEEAILRTIVQGPFARREWHSAGQDLSQYLSLPRSAGTEARARFYLGQTYYYSGKNREALIEFLFVQGSYPNEANEWIEAALAALAY